MREPFGKIGMYLLFSKLEELHVTIDLIKIELTVIQDGELVQMIMKQQ